MGMTALGDRMKGYENAYRSYLPKGFDVILRIDGRAFHTFTRGFFRPFDTVFMTAMKETAKALCAGIQGAQFAYTQSDEISILLRHNIEENEDPWFGNNIQKIVSVAASMATLEFNKAFILAAGDYAESVQDKEAAEKLNLYRSRFNTAMFDARVFIMPTNEVPNYFLWRQRDAERNSIQMVARSLYSHKELVGKKTAALHEMIHDKGQNWNDYPVDMKRGSVTVKKEFTVIDFETEKQTSRYRWMQEDPPFSTYDDWMMWCN